MKRIKTFLLIATGTLCVGLGILGMAIPVLPTTPFLLLAAFFYARSSDRFYHWLTTNRWFGDYIRNYREGKGIPLLQKALVIFLLWLSISYAVYFVVAQFWLKFILLGIALGVTYHLVTIKTFKPELPAPEFRNEPGSVKEIL